MLKNDFAATAHCWSSSKRRRGSEQAKTSSGSMVPVVSASPLLLMCLACYWEANFRVLLEEGVFSKPKIIWGAHNPRVLGDTIVHQSFRFWEQVRSQFQFSDGANYSTLFLRDFKSKFWTKSRLSIWSVKTKIRSPSHSPLPYFNFQVQGMKLFYNRLSSELFAGTLAPGRPMEEFPSDVG
ncbi:hypothetical protein BS78_01G481100 [Paspalum vaginatum]|nr:hypothetical protein BS78_01G481100 [Paspalum vaginatum]